MKFIQLQILVVSAFLLSLTSCIKPGQYNAKDRYIVTSRNLNIRSDPTTLSKIIGSLSKGDTIDVLASDRYWMMINYGDQSGFVSNVYLKKMEPPPTPLLFSIIEKNSSPKSWRFWVVSLAMIVIWILTSTSVTRYENRLKKNLGLKTKNISISPLVFFVAGILTAVLYLFWKEQVIEYLFHNFTFNPNGMGMVAWAIWGQSVALISGLAIDFFGSIYKSGAAYGALLFLIELLESIIVLSTTLFLTISTFLFAIIVLTIFFAMQYITLVSENSKSFSEILSGR